jgi:hypothetical protein
VASQYRFDAATVLKVLCQYADFMQSSRHSAQIQPRIDRKLLSCGQLTQLKKTILGGLRRFLATIVWRFANQTEN